MRLHRKIIQTVVEIKWAGWRRGHAPRQQDWQRIAASLEAELELVKGSPPHAEMAEALTALSMGRMASCRSAPDWEAAEAFALDAVKISERLNDPRILSRALDALAGVYDGRSRLREHLRVALRRLAITQSAGFDDLREQIDALRGSPASHGCTWESTWTALPPLRGGGKSRRKYSGG